MGLLWIFLLQNAATFTLRDASDANSYFRQGLARRTEKSTDYGPAQKNAATIIHIDLQVVRATCINPFPKKTVFLLVCSTSLLKTLCERE